MAQSIMKAIHILISSALIAGCTISQKQSTSVISFRGAALEAPPLADMVRLEKWPEGMGLLSREISDAYARPNESKKVGDLTIKEVTYEYLDQKLFRIEIDLWTEAQKRCPQASELLAALESQYGISMDRHKVDYAKPQFYAQWRGSRAHVTYMCMPWNSTNSIVIESPDIKQEVEARLQAIKSANEAHTFSRMKRALQ